MPKGRSRQRAQAQRERPKSWAAQKADQSVVVIEGRKTRGRSPNLFRMPPFSYRPTRDEFEDAVWLLARMDPELRSIGRQHYSENHYEFGIEFQRKVYLGEDHAALVWWMANRFAVRKGPLWQLRLESEADVPKRRAAFGMAERRLVAALPFNYFKDIPEDVENVF